MAFFQNARNQWFDPDTRITYCPGDQINVVVDNVQQGRRGAPHRNNNNNNNNNAQGTRPSRPGFQARNMNFNFVGGNVYYGQQDPRPSNNNNNNNNRRTPRGADRRHNTYTYVGGDVYIGGVRQSRHNPNAPQPQPHPRRNNNNNNPREIDYRYADIDAVGDDAFHEVSDEDDNMDTDSPRSNTPDSSDSEPAIQSFPAQSHTDTLVDSELSLATSTSFSPTSFSPSTIPSIPSIPSTISSTLSTAPSVNPHVALPPDTIQSSPAQPHTDTPMDSEPSSSTISTAPALDGALANTYVALQLDIEATIQSLPVQHPALISAVRNMETKYFIGYIETEDDFQDPRQEFHVHLLRSGLLTSELEHLTENMCVPVLPSSSSSDREPLRPDLPFPSSWGAECYHMSNEQLVVRIVEEPPALLDEVTRMPLNEVMRHNVYLLCDYNRRTKEARRRMRQTKIAKKALENLVSNSNSSADSGTSHVTLDDNALQEAELNVASKTKSSKALKRSLAALMQAQATPIMTVRVSHDLSIVDKLSDPRELLSQQVYLADWLKKYKRSEQESKQGESEQES